MSVPEHTNPNFPKTKVRLSCIISLEEVNRVRAVGHMKPLTEQEFFSVLNASGMKIDIQDKLGIMLDHVPFNYTVA